MNAADALEGTIQAAVDKDVEYVNSQVSRLLIEDGVWQGAETENGHRYKASKVLLSAGADTARLLAESAPHQTDMHAGDRFVAAAILEAKVKLTEEQIETFQSMPAALWDAEPVKGEVMPVSEDGYLKFIRDVPVKNTQLHPASNTRISWAPESMELTQWTDPSNMPQRLQDEIDVVIDGIFGAEEASRLRPEKLRLCWEPLAPDENWFVTPHTRCKGL